MNFLRRRLAARGASDAGFSLVEVLVGLMVFSLIATGVAYTMLAALTATSDSQARVEASNLAAQEIDLDRSIADLFDLLDSDKFVQVNGIGRTYHIHRVTQWVSDPAVAQKCGAGGGVLKYKSVNVTVSWTGMSNSARSVTASTLIDPGTRLNDPALGTILVSVITASGSGSAGVTVTATPSAVANGAQSITTTIDPTDAQGCTYILQVVPGNYDVKIVKAGFLDVNQASSSTVTVGVIAGAAASVGLQFDNAGAFGLAYASNYTPGGVTIPTNLSTSFLSTYGTYVNSTPSTPMNLYPFTAGYQIIAGSYVDPSLPSRGCASVDPSTWPAGTNVAGTSMKAGVRPSAVAAVPGGVAPTAAIAMGVGRVSGLSSNPFISAVETSGASNTGDPGCSVTSSYSFGKVSSSSFLAGLPFGSWRLYTSSTLGGATTQIAAANLAVMTGGSVDSSGIVTLDPRQVGP